MVQLLIMKFDLVFSNPPYTKNADIKLLNQIIHVADEWIIIHPSLWLLDSKGVYKAYSDFKKQIEQHIVSVEMFNGNYIFDIELNVPIAITHINFKYKGDVDVLYFSDKFKASCTDDITKYGSKWNSLVKIFYMQMVSYCQKNSSVWNKKIEYSEVDRSKYHCQFADIRGSKNKKSVSEVLVKDDFYTITVRENPNDNIILRKETFKNTYEFDTAIERDNFVKYMNTFFARFCLSLLKTNTHIDSGELGLIPWLDFTEEWDDDKLFQKFNVSQDLQDYIYQFLPDFYDIKK